jgi:phosphate transport system substrate-binding protein
MPSSFKVRRALLTRVAGGALAIAVAVSGTVNVAHADTQLTGAGSTFDYPFFSAAFYKYSKDHPGLTVNYQSIGSGGGIQQFSAGTVSFGASDVPMNSEELKKAGFPIVQVPVALGGEGIGYNLPGIKKGLKFNADVLSGIYLGKITKWNDPEIQKLNPNTKLPDLAITVVHRSDGSGTTYIFTDYLSHVSPEWKSKVGAGKAVSWPAPSSIGGKGNEGVAGLVGNTPGAIGYIELAYLLQNDMTYGRLENSAGSFLYPSVQTVSAAAATKPDVSSTNFSIVDSNCKSCYPISGYSWGLLRQHYDAASTAKEIKTLFTWLSTKAQPIAKTISYVPLPENVQQMAVGKIKEIN